MHCAKRVVADNAPAELKRRDRRDQVVMKEKGGR